MDKNQILNILYNLKEHIIYAAGWFAGFYIRRQDFGQIELLPEEYVQMIKEEKADKEQVVCDYIAGMSDQYSVSKFQDIFVPKSWKG